MAVDTYDTSTTTAATAGEAALSMSAQTDGAATAYGDGDLMPSSFSGDRKVDAEEWLKTSWTTSKHDECRKRPPQSCSAPD